MPAFVWVSVDSPPTAGAPAWLAFAYLTVFSQLVGFFFWYGGLARGGVAAVSQVQLLQLFLTLGFAAVLNGERLDPLTGVAALAVVALVALGRGGPVSPPPAATR